MAVAVRSPVERASLEALLGAQPDIRITPVAAEADVIVSDGIPEDREGAVVLLSPDPHRGWRSAMRRGVRAVLGGDATAAQLAAAVAAVAAGLVVLHPEDLGALGVPAQTEAGLDAALAEPLTPREVEVLTLMAEGFSNKEIAGRLDISNHTVKFHVASILGKLGAGSRTEAVSIGLRQGLVML